MFGLIKTAVIEITNQWKTGFLFKKYMVCGEIIIDGVRTGDLIEFEMSKTKYSSSNIGGLVYVPSYWNGKYYSFSDFDLPNHRKISVVI